MESYFYTYTLNLLYVVCLFAGIMMFSFSKEKKEKFVTYKRSRYIAGIVLLIYSVFCFTYSHFGLRDINKLHASAISLSVYYISGILFGYSLIPLLNKAYLNRRRIILDCIRYLIFLVFIAATFVLDTPYSKITLALSAVYFFFDILRIVFIFKKSYQTCINDLNNYYSVYNIESYVNWMYKVTILIIIYGLSFTFIVYTTKFLIASFSFLGIFLFAYIVCSYNNYLMHVEKIDITQKEPIENDNTCNQKVADPLTYSEISERLQLWIDEKGYLNEGLTIMTLSSELNTNRTYLSCYINNTYECTFRSFISKLRIEEVKFLLINEYSKDINEIATITGFSSTSNFYRTFKNIVNETPNEYRENNRLNK